MPLGAFRLNSLAKLISGGAPAEPSFGVYKVLHNPNPFGTSAGDSFTSTTGAVSICELYAIAGAPTEDESGGVNSGKAYIYDNSDGSLLYTLSNPSPYGTVANDAFGTSVGICNSYAIVGAPQEDDASGSGTGKAYIYDTSDGLLLYTLSNPNAYDTVAGDNFGTKVGICESYAIVTAPNEDDASGTQSGKAYIYSTATGSLLYTLNNPNPYSTSTDDQFGADVSICESYAIVTAPQEDEESGVSSGKAYIYDTSDGSLLYTLNNPNAYDTVANDQFGSSVSICESYAIVGAPSEDEAAGITSGKAYIYSTATGSLLYTLNNPNPYGTVASDTFANKVSITESYALVGAQNEDSTVGLNDGKAYIYSTATGSLLQTLDNPNAYVGPASATSDQFGSGVAITESYAIVGAVSEDDASGAQSGKAYLYNKIAESHITVIPQYFFRAGGASSLTSTIVIPSGSSQVGDIAVLCDMSTTTTDTTPSGWTSINGVTTTGIRTNISYKVLTSGDIGATITGMAGTTRKVLMIFRDITNTTPTVSISTVSSEATTAAPANQTITAGSGKSVYFGVYSKTTSTTPTTALTQTNVTSTLLSSVSTSGIYVRYNIFEGENSPPHSNATVTMTDAGTNTLQSFRMDIS